MKEDRLRWGIIGCAGIAEKSVIPGILQSESSRVEAVSSRNRVQRDSTHQHRISSNIFPPVPRSIRTVSIPVTKNYGV